jgi:hypothetical protein
MGVLPDVYVHDWAGMQRNFTALTSRFLEGRGAPDASDKGPLGALYTDTETGDLYVLKTSGWVAL